MNELFNCDNGVTVLKLKTEIRCFGVPLFSCLFESDCNVYVNFCFWVFVGNIIVNLF